MTVLLFLSAPLFAGAKDISLKTFSFFTSCCSAGGEYFYSKHRLAGENKLLRKRAADLSLEVARLEELRGENRRLRALLGFKKKIGFDTVSAEVIARDPNDWIGSFVINKGTRDGIRKDSAVCSAGGLLGKVAGVRENTSSVMLVTHPGFKAGGMLKNSRISGVVTGAGKGKLKMIYIPMDAEVARGDVVMTSSFSRIFPKGITIGEVVSVGKSKTGLYKHATIKPSADSFRQEEVLCIR